MNTSQSIPENTARVSSAGNSRLGTYNQIASRTPRKQQQMHAKVVPESQSEIHRDDGIQSVSRTGKTGYTATELPTSSATPTPTPHRYGLRARRASRGSFSTPSRCRRTASQQHTQHLSTPTKTSGSGAAAIRTGSPLSYHIDH
ncbi:hypothetical protein N5P37_003447 [Trichoderma harzianum]|uniref:Uncharacterized protein n=1 Tax=Trichoderma harzianum CBS 226.95 TaxID=983964 RepID=A0A2T4AUG5_TRIHA|nr:hypothetical protein M431DRAFT_489476 [Trichoderma harzianum CBS 226.95]KAK0764052.1 hypothetical protein N5P37_003447 [Trichoderma harzianum]PKK54700.1 hypothetical protein CI102_447 [Trichoderma harzianum]PTB60704.1 hypothetical protein M431DRAFT_489476 [Trichoderma harzianum CBS 226.95]